MNFSEKSDCTLDLFSFNVVRLESIQSELHRESKLRKELEQKLVRSSTDRECSLVSESQLKVQIKTLLSDVVCITFFHLHYIASRANLG